MYPLAKFILRPSMVLVELSAAKFKAADGPHVLGHYRISVPARPEVNVCLDLGLDRNGVSAEVVALARLVQLLGATGLLARATEGMSILEQASWWKGQELGQLLSALVTLQGVQGEPAPQLAHPWG